MPLPSGRQHHILANTLSAPTYTIHNIHPGSRPLRGELRLGFFRGTFNEVTSFEVLDGMKKNTDLSSFNIMTLCPVIGLLLRALPEVHLECIALLWGRNLGHGRPIGRLPRFWLLIGTQHHEEGFPTLNRAHRTRGIRTAISNAVHVIVNWGGGQSNRHEVALSRTCTSGLTQKYDG